MESLGLKVLPPTAVLRNWCFSPVPKFRDKVCHCSKNPNSTVLEKFLTLFQNQ